MSVKLHIPFTADGSCQLNYIYHLQQTEVSVKLHIQFAADRSCQLNYIYHLQQTGVKLHIQFAAGRSCQLNYIYNLQGIRGSKRRESVQYIFIHIVHCFLICVVGNGLIVVSY